MALHAPINWAQRNDVVLVTIPIQDATDVKISLTDVFSFSCTSSGKQYTAEFSLFDKVVPEESSHVVRPRQIELKIRKADVEKEYWPRITKDKVKSQYIQIDWNKWKDEDDEGAAAQPDDLGDFGMGGGGGMGGMDMQAMLAQLGGGGAGLGDFGSAAGQQAMDPSVLDNVEDEDMPPLEG